MKIKLFILAAIAAPALLFGQAANRATQKAAIDTNFPSDTPGAITAANLRTITKQIVDSAYNPIDDGAPGASWPVGMPEKWVSTAGNDTTGDGTPTKPYATVSKAMTSITDATATKLYTIRVGPGKFTETALALKPFVWIVGNGNTQGGPTRINITGAGTALTADPSFNVIAGARGGVTNVYFNGSTGLNFNLQATGSFAATILELTNVTFASSVTYTAGNQGDGLDWRGGETFGAITIHGGGSNTFQNVFALNTLTLTDTVANSTNVSFGFQAFNSLFASAVTETTTHAIASDAQFIACNLASSLSMTQTAGTLTTEVDAISYPQGGATVTSGTLTKTTPADSLFGAVSTVSPTSPNRTIAVKIGGTTFYIAAKTTND